MVRGGLGGARMVPGKDIWQVSELGCSTISSAYQVGLTVGPVLLDQNHGDLKEGGACTEAASHTHTDHLPSRACLCHFSGSFFDVICYKNFL